MNEARISRWFHPDGMHVTTLIQNSGTGGLSRAAPSDATIQNELEVYAHGLARFIASDRAEKGETMFRCWYCGSYNPIGMRACESCAAKDWQRG